MTYLTRRRPTCIMQFVKYDWVILQHYIIANFATYSILYCNSTNCIDGESGEKGAELCLGLWWHCNTSWQCRTAVVRCDYSHALISRHGDNRATYIVCINFTQCRSCVVMVERSTAVQRNISHSIDPHLQVLSIPPPTFKYYPPVFLPPLSSSSCIQLLPSTISHPPSYLKVLATPLLKVLPTDPPVFKYAPSPFLTDVDVHVYMSYDKFPCCVTCEMCTVTIDDKINYCTKEAAKYIYRPYYRTLV